MKPVRWSNLKHIGDSPATYQHRLGSPIEPSAVMRFGSLVHYHVFGVSPDEWIVWPGARRGKEWITFKEDCHESGSQIVTQDEWDRATACAAAVKADPLCGPLLHSGSIEQRLAWEIAGRACTGTPDHLKGGVLTDLKVTGMVNPARFPYHCRKMGWHGQLAWYKNAVEAGGGTVESVYIVAVDPKPPYLCVPYLVTDDTLEIGEKSWRSLFERLRVCEESDQWPGYTQSVVPLEIYDDEVTLTIGGEEVEL